MDFCISKYEPQHDKTCLREFLHTPKYKPASAETEAS